MDYISFMEEPKLQTVNLREPQLENPDITVFTLDFGKITNVDCIKVREDLYKYQYNHVGNLPSYILMGSKVYRSFIFSLWEEYSLFRGSLMDSFLGIPILITKGDPLEYQLVRGDDISKVLLEAYKKEVGIDE